MKNGTNKLLSLTSLLLIVLFLSACTKSVEDYSATYDSGGGLKIEEKQGTTEVRGKVVKTGSTFYLLLDDNSRLEIDSYAINLADYTDERVTIMGQYSGNTLFVGEVVK